MIHLASKPGGLVWERGKDSGAGGDMPRRPVQEPLGEGVEVRLCAGGEPLRQSPSLQNSPVLREEEGKEIRPAAGK